jgi:hypothetical protein
MSRYRALIWWMGIEDAWLASSPRVRRRSRIVLACILCVFGVGVASAGALSAITGASQPGSTLREALVVLSIGQLAGFALPLFAMWWLRRAHLVRTTTYTSLDPDQLRKHLNNTSGRDYTVDEWIRVTDPSCLVSRAAMILLALAGGLTTLALFWVARELVSDGGTTSGVLSAASMLLTVVLGLGAGWYAVVVATRAERLLHGRLTGSSGQHRGSREAQQARQPDARKLD